MSAAAICWVTTPTRASTCPPSPEMRNLRPLRSSTELISLRNHPPIWQPEPPASKPTTLNLASASSMISAPPPNASHACCWRVLRPNGMPVPKASVGSLPM